MRGIRITGVDEKGREHSTNYVFFADSDFNAIRDALNYADNDYNCEHDENHKPIPGSSYKEFVTITSVVVVHNG